MLISNISLILIVIGFITLFAIYVKELSDNNEINLNQNKINKITDITVKTNLTIGFIAILIIIFYLF